MRHEAIEVLCAHVLQGQAPPPHHSDVLGISTTDYLNNSRKISAFVISNQKFTWFHCFAWTSAFSTAQISSTNHVGANIFTGPISIRNTLFSCKHIHRQILQSFWYLSIVWIKNKSILRLVLTVIYKLRGIKWIELKTFQLLGWPHKKLESL